MFFQIFFIKMFTISPKSSPWSGQASFPGATLCTHPGLDSLTGSKYPWTEHRESCPKRLMTVSITESWNSLSARAFAWNCTGASVLASSGLQSAYSELFIQKKNNKLNKFMDNCKTWVKNKKKNYKNQLFCRCKRLFNGSIYKWRAKTTRYSE